jgi:hypothetical protein
MLRDTKNEDSRENSKKQSHRVETPYRVSTLWLFCFRCTTRCFGHNTQHTRSHVCRIARRVWPRLSVARCVCVWGGLLPKGGVLWPRRGCVLAN